MRRSRPLLLLTVVALLASLGAAPVRAAPAVDTTFTILHTNDFHGQLEPSGSNPGMARVAKVVNDIRAANTAVGRATLLADVGDEMQGSLLSNIQKGVPTIATYNAMGYDVATFGNHEFDWGKDTLTARVGEAAYPYVSANIVVNNTGNCATAGWTSPSFVDAPYQVETVGTAPNEVKVGFIGVTSQETPIITIAAATEGLCFKDPAESIVHYYDAMKAAGADVIVVLSHLGYGDGGYGYGVPIYGDVTLAKKLNAASKPANLILGGHSHSNLSAATIEGATTIAHAYYNGRTVGRADITVTPAGTVSVAWSRTTGFTSGAKDPTIDALIAGYASDPTYLALINQEIGYTNVPITRNYDGDSLMGAFVNDAIYGELNSDVDGDGTPITANDVEIVFNNSGGLRADITCAAYPCVMTYGMLFSVLPFGNQTIVGTMTGAQILELLHQAASLNKGAIQVSGIRYSFYNYRQDTDPTSAVSWKAWSWGAFDACVEQADGSCDPLDLAKTYKVATNEFLAPAGQDNFYAFKYMKNITYWGDMLNQVNAWVARTYTAASPYSGALDGRITRVGDDAGGPIVPVTILHHNDSHGNLAKGSFVGYTQLATLIKQERAYNPDRTILLSGGDNIQGDAMSYYFKSAPLGYAADGTALPADLQMQPLIKAFNAMGYDGMTLGNHEFNFGSEIFTAVLGDAEFPLLGANVSDTGAYGLADVGVEPYVEKTVGPEGVKVAILGITNHRVPNYELPSNIPGLAFSDPLAKAEELATALGPTNDAVVALTHIGFTEDPKSVEVDKNVDTNLAMAVGGIDAIIGSHSHTNPATGFGDYKYLPSLVENPTGDPVIINQAYRYNNTLGEVFLGFRPNIDAALAELEAAYAAGGITSAGVYASLLEKLSDASELLDAGKTKAARNVLSAFIAAVNAQTGKKITADAAATLIAAAQDVIARPDGYAVASQAGQYLSVDLTKTAEDAAIKAIVDPYVAKLAAYNNTVIGQTTVPIDALKAFTQETNAANLQADSSVFELNKNGITPDIHLSGAMTNRAVATTGPYPVTLKVSDMFTLMPYENSLVVLNMNGPQIKAVLERAYRNYYYYKYVPGYGGYSYYTTCMLDTNFGGQITYDDLYPAAYDPATSYVVSLKLPSGDFVDFDDASTYYKVSTVNYLAAGSCNFNNSGVSLWPLDQIANDTQYYVRDAVIDYLKAQTEPISPAIEGRLVFL